MRSRREFIRYGILISPVIGTLLYGCTNAAKKELPADPCQDLSDLTEDEMAIRQQLGYTEQSSFADRNCLNCNLFVKSDDSLACGSCLALKGPVADEGYCTVWAPV